MSRPTHPAQLGIRLTWVLDAIALGSLYLTAEIRKELFIGIIASLIVRRFVRLNISQFVLVSSLGIVFICAALAWRLLGIPPIDAAAHAFPVVHTLVWFARPGQLSGWRLVFGFIELTIAATLSAEAYLAVAIFAFVLLASVAQSCSFLANELQTRDPGNDERPLPKGFVGKTAATSFLILLTSILIFPLLPRMKTDGIYVQDNSKIGYTEEVNLSDWTRFSGSETGNAVMWLYPSSETDLSEDMYLHLIRGRVLDIFNGTTWSPGPRFRNTSNESEEDPPTKVRTVRVEAVRAPLGTDILPVPYGTQSVLMPVGNAQVRNERQRGGEWVDRHTRDRKVKYYFEFAPYTLDLRDQPQALHQFIPPQLKTDRIQKIVKKIFGNASTTKEKIDRLQSYFRQENFQASPFGVEQPTREQADKLQLHPLEHFLFAAKEGHCELFASSFAVLLRMVGVPTRLVAGFRLSKPPAGNLVTIRSTEAHAWAEAWVPGKGWMPLDPTPRILREGGMIDPLLEAYDWLSGYWYRYVLTFDEQREAGAIAVRERWKAGIKQFNRKTLIEWMREQGPIYLAVGFCLAGVGYLLRRRMRLLRLSWAEAGPRALRRERARMERLISRRPVSAEFSDPEARDALRAWTRRYEEVRFGNPSIHRLDEALPELAKSRARFAERIKKI